jgi:hypothetical protein
MNWFYENKVPFNENIEWHCCKLNWVQIFKFNSNWIGFTFNSVEMKYDANWCERY